MTDAPPAVRDTALPELDADLTKAMDAACGVLLANGLPDLANRARSQLTTPMGAPTVVVIGEVKRGKSRWSTRCWRAPMPRKSLDIATSAFLRFVPPRSPGRQAPRRCFSPAAPAAG